MGTDGTGTYIRARGQTSRLICSGYGFASIAPTQRHVDIAATAEACEVTIPFGASFANAAPQRNVVRFSAGGDGPILAAQGEPQKIQHGTTSILAFSAEIEDRRDEWNGRDSFTPREDGYYGWSGFIQLLDVAGGSNAAIILYDATANMPVARLDRCLGAGSPSIDFSFRERLSLRRKYQLRLTYSDGEGRGRATSGRAASNRMSIEKMK